MTTKIKCAAMENKYWLLGIHRTIIAEGKDTCSQYDFIERFEADDKDEYRLVIYPISVIFRPCSFADFCR